MIIKKTVSVDVEINTRDVMAWLLSASEFDLYHVFRQSAVSLGKAGVQFLRDNVPETAKTPTAIATLLAAETLAGGVIEAGGDEE